ncbi:MAG: glutathione S-transferase family protein [Paracoccaceae bacterium]|nr:glutathione S-transferase family protein [Paracoccaceae bacterium]
MKLYDAMTPNSLRVNVFLAEKGIEVAREKIDVMQGGTRTPAFLAKNSLGELPVLELDDGRILTESVAICRYFEALHPKPSLLGEDAVKAAMVEMWNRRIEFHIFGPIGDMGRHTLAFFADRLEQIPAYAASQKPLFAENWAWLDPEMCDRRPFIAGEAFTIADITGMAAIFVSDITGTPPPGGCDHAGAWAERMRARESFASLRQKAV